MSDDKSMVAIVPHGKVGDLMAQFLGSGSCGSQSKEAGGGKVKTKTDRKQQWRAGPAARSNRGRSQQRRGDRKQRNHQPLSQDLLPQWNGHQFVGDSMMVRLGMYASRANTRPTFNKLLNANQLGACIGGQTCGQLLRLLKSKECPKIGQKVILMIGTNNILKRVPSDATEQAFLQVIQQLQKSTEELIVLTIPPIPSLAKDENSQDAYRKLNDCIKNLTEDNGLQVIDLCHLFFSDNVKSVIKTEMFEKDLIHWNRAAMEMVLLELLD